MAYVIPNNSFSTDVLVIRHARLFLLSSNISPYLVELMFPPEYSSWAENAYTIFNAALGDQTVQTGEKEEAFRLYGLKIIELSDFYSILKSLLIARYRDAELPVSYGLKGGGPESKQDVVKASEMMINGHASRLAIGDPLVLPSVMIDKITTLLADAKTHWSGAYSEADDVESATAQMRAIYDEDTEMLRIIYNWICAIWSRSEPRLIEIGFVQRTYEGQGGGGGEVPVAPTGFTFEWLEPVLQFSWDAVEGATSYQIAFSEDGGEVWEELYTGEEVGYEYEPPEGLRQYRIRARNADGYGDWSNVIEYEIEGAPPMGEWPAELTGLYAIHHDVPVIFNEVGHDGQTGADSYRLKRVKVLIADPDPTNADMPVDNFVEGLNEDPYADADILPGDKCAYWACGVDAADVEGEWTGPVVGEYPV